MNGTPAIPPELIRRAVLDEITRLDLVPRDEFLRVVSQSNDAVRERIRDIEQLQEDVEVVFADTWRDADERGPQEIPPVPIPLHPFEVTRKTGLTGTINKGLIYSNPLTGFGTDPMAFDTEFIDTTVPVPGNVRMVKTDMVFADNATTAVLIKATYNSWELPDDGEVRCYSTGYTFDKDLCTFDPSSLTMSTYIDDFTWPNAGGAQTKYFPVAIVQTSGGEITTILQLITNDFIDPFAYLTSTQTPI